MCALSSWPENTHHGQVVLFFLQTDCMLPKWLKVAEGHRNNLLEPGVKKILEDKKYAASVAVERYDEDDEQYEEEISYVCSYN